MLLESAPGSAEAIIDLASAARVRAPSGEGGAHRLGERLDPGPVLPQPGLIEDRGVEIEPAEEQGALRGQAVADPSAQLPPPLRGTLPSLADQRLLRGAEVLRHPGQGILQCGDRRAQQNGLDIAAQISRIRLLEERAPGAVGEPGAGLGHGRWPRERHAGLIHELAHDFSLDRLVRGEPQPGIRRHRPDEPAEDGRRRADGGPGGIDDDAAGGKVHPVLDVRARHGSDVEPAPAQPFEVPPPVHALEGRPAHRAGGLRGGAAEEGADPLRSVVDRIDQEDRQLALRRVRRLRVAGEDVGEAAERCGRSRLEHEREHGVLRHGGAGPDEIRCGDASLTHLLGPEGGAPPGRPPGARAEQGAHRVLAAIDDHVGHRVGSAGRVLARRCGVEED
jgi:hypothetical protein